MTIITRTCCRNCNDSPIKQPVILVSTNNRHLKGINFHNTLCPKGGVVNILCASDILLSSKKCPHCRVGVVGFVFEKNHRTNTPTNNFQNYPLNASHTPHRSKPTIQNDFNTTLLEGKRKKEKCCRITVKHVCCTVALGAITFLVFYVESNVR